MKTWKTRKKFSVIFFCMLLLAGMTGCIGDDKISRDLQFDDGDSLAISQGWYLADGSCLLYGDYIGAKGRQARLYWLDKPGEEPTCVWPLDGGWFAGDNEMLAYFLPGQNMAVLTNQTQNQTLLVDVTPDKKFDTPMGNKMEITLPRVPKQGDVSLMLWLAPGQYLVSRQQASGEEQNIRQALSLYDEGLQKERPLAELQGNICTVTVDGERNRLLLLSDLGYLCGLDLSAEAEAQVWHCPENWPTASAFNEYQSVQPVQQTEGDYVVLRVFCEDGEYYQVVDLAGEELGAYKAQGEIGNGLAAAAGQAIYVSEYFADDPQYKMVMYNFQQDESGIIQEGGSFGQTVPCPPTFGPACGTICPDGHSMLLFNWEYVTQRTALPTSLPQGR